MSEKEAVEIIRKMRFGSNWEYLSCPYCGSVDIVNFGWKQNKPHIRRYLCNTCGRIFNDLTKTPMNGSKLSLKEWILIIYLFFVRNEPIAEIARIIKRPYPTVWNAVKKLKKPNGFTAYLASMLAWQELGLTFGEMVGV